MIETAIYDLFISYTDADRAWVEGYLLDALDQAGMRIHSEAAFALGVPRLLEFERAIRQSRRTLLVLSPAYLADSFGQFTDLIAGAYGLETSTWPVIPLILHPLVLPARLATLQSLDGSDPASWPTVIARLCAEAERPVLEAAPAPECPYPGMAPFRETDSARFFGREREVRELVERLRLHPFITVIGPSGSGKSSLVFAGLLPALRQSRLFGAGGWLTRSMRPGEQPMVALDDTLAPRPRSEAPAHAASDGDPLATLLINASSATPNTIASTATTEPRYTVATDPTATIQTLLNTAPGARRLLLVVDQFEETFTVARTDAALFQQTLLRLADLPECCVVVTVRADFYPDLMVSPLWPRAQAHRMEVVPLNEDGLRQAIIRPAENAGVFVEAALVERLVTDAAGEPGALPLIQETLVLLWEWLERRFLPLRAYNALVLPRTAYDLQESHRTGLQVAMARRADATLAELPAEQQAIARRIFLRLIQFGEGRADTRRQQPVSVLCASGDDPLLFETTVRHLASNRLLTLTAEERGGRKGDIAHEALIGGWPTLQDWLKERREAEQIRRRLEDKAAEWVRLGRSASGLLDEVELVEAERWLAGSDADDLGFSAALPELVIRSRAVITQAKQEHEATLQRELSQAQALAEEQRQRAEVQTRATRRLRWAAAGLITLLITALIAGWFAIDQRNQARIQLVIAEVQESQKLAFTAQGQLRDAPETALLLAYEAIERNRNPVTEQALRDALERAPWNVTTLSGHTKAVLRAVFTRNGTHILTTSTDGTARLWDGEGHPVVTFAGHTDNLTSAVFSPDEQHVLTGSLDGTARLWDLGGHTLAIFSSGTKGVTSAFFSPDGQRILTAEQEGTARIWRLTGQSTATLSGHADLIRSAVFSPDGRYILTASFDKTARLWDMTGHLLATLAGHTDAVNSAIFNTAGSRILTASDDKTARLWDLNGRLLTTFVGHTDAVRSAIFSPDQQSILTASNDGTARLWDLDGQNKATLFGHTSKIYRAVFSPDGQRILTASDDKTARLWDLDGRSLLILSGHSGGVNSVVFRRDGQRVLTASADGTARLWDLTSQLGFVLAGHTDWVRSAVFSPDQQYILTSSFDKTARLWNRAGELSVVLAGHTAEVWSADFSPDSQHILTASGDHTARLWDLNGATIAVLSGHTDAVTSANFSPDGQRIVTASADKSARVWNLSGATIAVLSGHTDAVTSANFSPDGQRIVTASDDNTARLWDLSGHLLATFAGHTDAITSARFSPDGQRILTASSDNTARIWSLSGDTVATLAGHKRGVYDAVFSPDGQRILTVSDDQTARLWDLTGRALATLAGHTETVTSAVFSPDGQRILTASSDHTARLWDLVGQPLTTFSGHTAEVWSAVFSPDGKRVLTASDDFTARQYRINVDDLLIVAACRVGRGLTQDELERFAISTPHFHFEQRQCPPALL